MLSHYSRFYIRIRRRRALRGPPSGHGWGEAEPEFPKDPPLWAENTAQAQAFSPRLPTTAQRPHHSPSPILATLFFAPSPSPPGGYAPPDHPGNPCAKGRHHQGVAEELQLHPVAENDLQSHARHGPAAHATPCHVVDNQPRYLGTYPLCFRTNDPHPDAKLGEFRRPTVHPKERQPRRGKAQSSSGP